MPCQKQSLLRWWLVYVGQVVTAGFSWHRTDLGAVISNVLKKVKPSKGGDSCA